MADDQDDTPDMQVAANDTIIPHDLTPLSGGSGGGIAPPRLGFSSAGATRDTSKPAAPASSPNAIPTMSAEDKAAWRAKADAEMAAATAKYGKPKGLSDMPANPSAGRIGFKSIKGYEDGGVVNPEDDPYQDAQLNTEEPDQEGDGSDRGIPTSSDQADTSSVGEGGEDLNTNWTLPPAVSEALQYLRDKFGLNPQQTDDTGAVVSDKPAIPTTEDNQAAPQQPETDDTGAVITKAPQQTDDTGALITPVTQAIPTSKEPTGAGPLGNALRSGVQAVGGYLSKDKGMQAVGNRAQQFMSYLQGSGAMPSDTGSAIHQAVGNDPAAAVEYAYQKGDKDAAAGLLQYQRNFYNPAMAHAQAALSSGDINSAVNSANLAFSKLPTGEGITLAPSQTSQGAGVTATVIGQPDDSGRPALQQYNLAPNELGQLLQEGTFDRMLSKGVGATLEGLAGASQQGTTQGAAQAAPAPTQAPPQAAPQAQATPPATPPALQFGRPPQGPQYPSAYSMSNPGNLDQTLLKQASAAFPHSSQENQRMAYYRQLQQEQTAGALKRDVAQIQGGTRQGVANINAESRQGVANINAGARGATDASKERMQDERTNERATEAQAKIKANLKIAQDKNLTQEQRNQALKDNSFLKAVIQDQSMSKEDADKMLAPTGRTFNDLLGGGGGPTVKPIIQGAPTPTQPGKAGKYVIQGGKPVWVPNQ